MHTSYTTSPLHKYMPVLCCCVFVVIHHSAPAKKKLGGMSTRGLVGEGFVFVFVFVFPILTMGVFSHSMRTAPIITLFISGTPLKTTHLQKHV